jgi:hypothetical protein
MSSYRYKGEPAQRVFGALPEGDYQFVVTEAGEPYTSNNGNLTMRLRLTIQPSGMSVFANPCIWTDRDDEEQDGIAEFLLAVNRVPKINEEPNWKSLVGAKGKCRLKVEIAQAGALEGKEVNKVAFFHRPKQVGPLAQGARQNFTEAEIKKSQAAIAKTLGLKDPDLEPEPDDIPF